MVLPERHVRQKLGGAGAARPHRPHVCMASHRYASTLIACHFTSTAIQSNGKGTWLDVATVCTLHSTAPVWTWCWPPSFVGTAVIRGIGLNILLQDAVLGPLEAQLRKFELAYPDLAQCVLATCNYLPTSGVTFGDESLEALTASVSRAKRTVDELLELASRDGAAALPAFSSNVAALAALVQVCCRGHTSHGIHVGAGRGGAAGCVRARRGGGVWPGDPASQSAPAQDAADLIMLTRVHG